MNRLLACVVFGVMVASCGERRDTLEDIERRMQAERDARLRAMHAIAPVDRTVGGKSISDAFPDPKQADMVRLACAGDLVGLKASLGGGADPNGKGLDGVTPLVWVQQCESIPGMEALIDAGADLNADVKGYHGAAVWFAATMPNSEPLKLLLRRGADPNIRGSKGGAALTNAFNTGLDWGVWDNYYALLDAGAEISYVDGFDTIAEYAVHMSQFDKVVELLDRGYSTRLDWLGWICQEHYFAGSPELQPPVMAARDRVIDKLKERGIVFPIREIPSDRPDLGIERSNP